MKTAVEINHEISRLEKRNDEINELTKDVEVLWAWSVNNPLFHERHNNLFKIVALKWVLCEVEYE